MAMKGYSIFPKAPRLKLHHVIQFSVLSKTLVEVGGLTPLQRCSRRILQPQPTTQANLKSILTKAKINYYSY